MIFAELLMGLAAAAGALVVVLAGLVELAISLVFLAIELVSGLINLRTRRGDDQTPVQPSILTRLARSKWFRRVGIVACGCLLLTGLAGVILNLLFFDGTVRWLLRQGEARTGTRVQFQSASGNLFTGRLELRDVTLVRGEHPTTVFDLQAQTMRLDLNLLSMIFGPRTIESAEFTGLRGTAHRVGDPPSVSWFNSKRLVIDLLQLRDVQVTWTDHTRKRMVPFEITVHELTSENLRSRWLAMDLLFKTNGAGAINGGAFTVARATRGEGQETSWHFEGLPIEAIASYVGGPFTLLDSGHAEVRATTVWGESADRVLDMDWSFVFREVHASVPDSGGWRSTLARPVVAFINQHSDELPVSFKLKYEQGRFEGAASIEAAGLWDAVADGATDAIAKKLEVTRDRVEQERDQVVDRLRSLLPTSRGADDGQ